MRQVLMVLGLIAAPAFAGDWVPLDGPGVEAALTGRALDYGAATQDFSASGETVYVSGRPSVGRWAVRGDQYCSVWPPSGRWACFDVEVSADGQSVRFIGERNDVSVGAYLDQ